MEIRELAARILFSASLEEKLRPPETDLTDHASGAPLRVETPARGEDLQFARRRQAPAMPRPGAFSQPRKRGIAHHIMANHELQAVEVMAFVLLAFPEAPAEFRRRLVPILSEEQRHTQMHARRAAELGTPFGSLPVNCYIWKKAQSFRSVLDYVCGLPLVFENRNLDHTLEFAADFESAGDAKSAAIMRSIHRDEIGHVRFGMEWLRRLKPAGRSDWDVFCEHLSWPLRPEKAIGRLCHAAPRLAAGLSREFVTALLACREQETGR